MSDFAVNFHRPVAFRGYDARPLKAVYLQPGTEEDLEVARELSAIGKREGFKVLLQKAVPGRKTPSRWAQDNKIFLKNQKGDEFILQLPQYTIRMGVPGGGVNSRKEQYLAGKLADAIKVPLKKLKSYLEGGNIYLGTNAKGKSYAILGEHSVTMTAKLLAEKSGKRKNLDKTKKTIADELDIDPKNLHVISQPEFHIDMMVRPLTFPTVLVQDFEMSRELLKKVLKRTDLSLDDEIALSSLYRETNRYKKELASDHDYKPMDTVIKELEAKGFKPIRVPGVFGQPDGERVVNFLNAVVHKRKNADLVYMTNGSALEVLNEEFEKIIKTKAPQIKKVDFLTGGMSEDEEGLTFLEDILTRLSGGLHCMVAERPV